MDKFKLLEQKLEDLITRLNQEIEEKQKEASIKGVISAEKEKKKEEIISKLQNSKNDLAFLKMFANKNVFITVIKECNKILWQNIKQAQPFEIFIIAILLLFLLGVSIFIPLCSIPFLSIVVLFDTIITFYINHEVRKIRKKANIPDLEKEIKSLEEELTKREEQKKEEDKELANIIFELRSLIEERDDYLEDLKKVQEVRISALEQVAKVNVVNAIYHNSRIEESLNIRLREKKEGK